MRLVWITIAGLVAMLVLTLLLLELETFLLDHGYQVSRNAINAIFFLVVGGAYGLFAQLALKEIRSVQQGKERAR